MNQNPIDRFKTWLEAYGNAWRTGDPAAAVKLFSQDARYEETPFDVPIVGRDAIHRYWLEGANRSQRDVAFSFQIITVQGSTGTARWQAKFIRVPSGTLVELDGVLIAGFSGKGTCIRFQEWWHRRETKGGESITAVRTNALPPKANP